MLAALFCDGLFIIGDRDESFEWSALHNESISFFYISIIIVTKTLTETSL